MNCDLLKSILHLTLLIMTVVEIRFFSLLFFKEELLLFAALSSTSLRELVHHRVQTPQPVHRAFSGFQLPGGGVFLISPKKQRFFRELENNTAAFYLGSSSRCMGSCSKHPPQGKAACHEGSSTILWDTSEGVPSQAPSTLTGGGRS